MLKNANRGLEETSPLLNPIDSLPVIPPASKLKALMLAEASLPRQSDGSLYPLNTQDIGKLGVGVGLYFNFVFLGGWLFALLSLLNLPSIISNAGGSAAMSPQERITFPRNLIASLSLGNHPAGEPVTLHAFMDFVSSFAFIIFICLFRRTQVRKAQEIELENITVGDYSVHVMGLPPDATDSQEIGTYFSRYGDVARVAISVDNIAILDLLREKEEVADKIEQCSVLMSDESKAPVARKEKGVCHRRMEEINTKLQSLRLVEDPPCTGHAFVTFTLESGARRCIEDFRQYKKFFGMIGGAMEQSKRFRGVYDLSVDKAPQPSDIIWEHLPYNLYSRIWRQLLTTLLSLFLVLIATALICAVNLKHFIFPVSHQALLEAIGLNAVTLIVVLGANIFLFIVIPKLASVEKYHYRSSQEVLIMLRLLSFQVLNTVIAALVLWDSSTDVNDETNWLHWYADGGSMIFNILIGDALLMNAIEFFRPFDVLLNRKYFAKHALTQKSLDKAYELPMFSLGMRFQFTLKAIGVSLFFGSGMPLLYPVGALCFFLTYWVDKYNLLRVYQKPPTYDDSVATISAVLVLPLAMVFHLITGMYFYNVVVECPTHLLCPPTSKMTLPLVLLCVDLAALFAVWHPLLLRHPDVPIEMVRAREVPVNCVKSISSYEPPQDSESDNMNVMSGGRGRRRGGSGGLDSALRMARTNSDDGEIGISVF